MPKIYMGHPKDGESESSELRALGLRYNKAEPSRIGLIGLRSLEQPGYESYVHHIAGFMFANDTKERQSLHKSASPSSFQSPNASLYSNLHFTSRSNLPTLKRSRESLSTQTSFSQKPARKQERTNSQSSLQITQSPLLDLFDLEELSSPTLLPVKSLSKDISPTFLQPESSLHSFEPISIQHIQLPQRMKITPESKEESMKPNQSVKDRN
jgi:hypothetical protein